LLVLVLICFDLVELLGVEPFLVLLYDMRFGVVIVGGTSVRNSVTFLNRGSILAIRDRDSGAVFGLDRLGLDVPSTQML
jgi:hypothetical protein